MKYFFQHLVSLSLPAIVLIFIPWTLDRHPVLAPMLPLALGLLIMAAGLFVMAETILTFIRIGRGTLAPWSPTRRLVAAGMYAYVRNPMILGVITVLIGESIALLSLPILVWAVLVFVINTVYFVFSEEPGLEKRFGDEYREYKRNVPRWIPRRTPWTPGREQ